MNIKKRYTLLPLAILMAFASGCDVDKTQDGELPDVDVDVEEGRLPDVDISVTEGEMPDVEVDASKGRLPEYDVDFVDVDVGMKTKTVKVPKVKVYFEEEEIEVPYIDFNMPDDANGASFNQTLTVEALAPGTEHVLKIEQVLIEGDDIYVLSTLKAGSNSVRNRDGVPVRDTVVIKAPDMDVEYLILSTVEDIDLDGFDAEVERRKSDFDVDWNRAKVIYKADR